MLKQKIQKKVHLKVVMIVRIRQSDANRYVQEPNRVEQHLINIIKRYFESDMEMKPDVKEAIINEAVSRTKSDLYAIIKKTAIEVTRTDLKTEIESMIQQQTTDIVKDIRDEVMQLQSQQITSDKLKIKITEPTTIIDLPSNLTIDLDYDYLTCHVNGQKYDDYTTVKNNKGFDVSLNFGEDVLIEDDIVTIECIILNMGERVDTNE